MRDKLPLAMLMALAKKAAPTRDFKGAILAKTQQTGAGRGEGTGLVCAHCCCGLHGAGMSHLALHPEACKAFMYW